jgi:hypothetical protein
MEAGFNVLSYMNFSYFFTETALITPLTSDVIIHNSLYALKQVLKYLINHTKEAYFSIGHTHIL